MRAGAFDRRITILRAGEPIDDGYTMQSGALETYAARWAMWKPDTRSEQFENAQNIGKLGGRFHLRSDTQTRTVTETDKVQYKDQVFDILGVSEIGRGEVVELLVAAAR